VIDLRSLRPFDVATVAESVKKTNRVVSVEEGWPFAGIGSEIAAIVMEECFDWLDAPLKRVAGKDVPLPYAANLERLAVPQVEDIVAAAREVRTASRLGRARAPKGQQHMPIEIRMPALSPTMTEGISPAG